MVGLSRLGQVALIADMTVVSGAALGVMAVSATCGDIVTRAQQIESGGPATASPAKWLAARTIAGANRCISAGFRRADAYLAQQSTRHLDLTASTVLKQDSAEKQQARLQSLKFYLGQVQRYPQMGFSPDETSFHFASPEAQSFVVGNNVMMCLMKGDLFRRSQLLFWRAKASPSALQELRATIQKSGDEELLQLFDQVDREWRASA